MKFSDLPPGVGPNDIPGNDSADETYHACVDELAGIGIDPVLAVQLIKAIAPILQEELRTAHRSGYAAGRDDGINAMTELRSQQEPHRHQPE